MKLFDVPVRHSAADAKPFLKWAGGKTQLLPVIDANLPAEVKAGRKTTYIEPFIGGGAVLFWILNAYPNIEQAIINDVNTDLTTAYSVIRDEPTSLIKCLTEFQQHYHGLETLTDKERYFMEQRALFNTRSVDLVTQSALLIFLNKTCFNGLYRVNSKNLYNVPFGKHAKPNICDEATILSDSILLQRVTILNGDYSKTQQYATDNTFFYFDPPYRPLSKTAGFNSYAKGDFNDSQQSRLAEFCKHLSEQGYRWLLSNSDPKNTDLEDRFFDDLYARYNIQRVGAKRFINADATKRGSITEILVSNY